MAKLHSTLGIPVAVDTVLHTSIKNAGRLAEKVVEAMFQNSIPSSDHCQTVGNVWQSHRSPPWLEPLESKGSSGPCGDPC